MSGLVTIVVRKPGDCHDTEIGAFKALVLAGSEVSPKGLEARIHSATFLVFLTIRCCLSGVAALKRPEARYRMHVSSSSGVLLRESEFPYELGWVFVLPSARGRRLSLDLTRAALSGAGTDAVFATSRTDNVNMHATLTKFNFVPEGRPYASRRGGHKLQLFLRRPIQPSATQGQD